MNKSRIHRLQQDRTESDRRWAAAKAQHWHDCTPSAATEERDLAQRAA